jgi:hypothetical protein
MYSKLIQLICAIALVAVVLAAEPPKPTWPSAFVTGVDEVREHSGEVRTGLWFYDQTQDAERFDVETERLRAIEIFEYREGKAYLAEYLHHEKPTCKVHELPNHMPAHDFSNYEFVGRESIRGHNTNKWVRNTTTSTFVYWADETTEDPIQFDREVKDKIKESVHFFAFDRTPQDPYIFNATYELPVCHGQFKQGIIPKAAVESLYYLPSDTCHKAAEHAKHYASCGCPYVWGGTSCGCGGSGGMDCSGLVYTSYRQAGWNGIARTTSGQVNQGSSCGSCSPHNTASCHVGDLFFYSFGGTNDHVLMYIGGNYVAECPHTGLNCRVIHPYTEHYSTCRRFC